MKIAFVRHVDVGSVDTMAEVRKLVVPVSAILAGQGFKGFGVGLFCSPKAYTLLAVHNNFPAPRADDVLSYDAQGKGRTELKYHLRKGTLFTGFSEGLVFVTHESVITMMTGRERIEYGEVVVKEYPHIAP